MDDEEEYKDIPKFLDIKKATHRAVYQAMVTILANVMRLRCGKVVKQSTILAISALIERDFTIIMDNSTISGLFDIKMYLLNIIQSWIDEDVQKEEYESASNLIKISDALWLNQQPR